MNKSAHASLPQGILRGRHPSYKKPCLPHRHKNPPSWRRPSPSSRYLGPFSRGLVSSVPCRHLSPPPRRHLSLAIGGHLILPPARFLSPIPRRHPL
ncbi:UNVERIFIED_CONTAM: hypothetical protein Sradi_4430700 [Sesamum radiatum]|uniref:Uncharacterized protein n=1 Tax=Sesamum radiatum TaxID=300843 RepID=A0AAW2NQB2_SESRA